MGAAELIGVGQSHGMRNVYGIVLFWSFNPRRFSVPRTHIARLILMLS
jgi:hypothetical protein